MRLGSSVLVLFVAGACERQPASIKVKLPQDSFASVRMDPVVPPFEKKNDTLQLRASAFGSDGAYMGAPKQVRWSSADPAVAAVSLDGLVSIVGSGQTEIKAETVGYDQTLEARLPIKAVIVERLEVVAPEGSRDPAEIHLGETLQFTAKVYDDRNNLVPDAKVTWRTSDYAATVSPTGEVEGRAIGDTQVIAESAGKVARLRILVLDWKKR